MTKGQRADGPIAVEVEKDKIIGVHVEKVTILRCNKGTKFSPVIYKAEEIKKKLSAIL